MFKPTEIIAAFTCTCVSFISCLFSLSSCLQLNTHFVGSSIELQGMSVYVHTHKYGIHAAPSIVTIFRLNSIYSYSNRIH